ncbi:hypothetical protein COL08_23025 [Priestia megaterium]|nr:hypothetical protein COL08_23025 [Priestia megaterium]
MALYYVVNFKGDTIDFYLSKIRDPMAAKCFFKKTLPFFYVLIPRVIMVNKNTTYPIAIKETKNEKRCP